MKTPQVEAREGMKPLGINDGGRYQRPVRKMVQHIDDAIYHLSNVQGLSKDQCSVIGNYLAQTRQMLNDAFGEEK